MSTHWGFTCLTHQPHINSGRLLNHGEALLLDAYFKVRAGRWPLLTPAEHFMGEQVVPIFAPGYPEGTDAPIYWLREHPDCDVALADEYGEEIDLPGGSIANFDLAHRPSRNPQFTAHRLVDCTKELCDLDPTALGVLPPHIRTAPQVVTAQTDRAVDHPEYYGGGDNPYEAIKVIQAWELDFELGSALKYIARAGKKTPSATTDLEKAIRYLQFELEKLERNRD